MDSRKKNSTECSAIARIVHMIYEDDEDEIIEELTSVALAMAAEGEYIRKSRRCGRSALTRADLPPNLRSGTSWECIYAGGHDAAFITTTGFDVASFHFLLRLFSNVWDRVPVPRLDIDMDGVSRSSRRSLSPAGALGLVLHFLNSTMAEKSHQETFAVTPTVCSRYINFGLKILLETLKLTREEGISWPRSHEQLQYYVDIIADRHPALSGAFCFVDGVKIPVAESLGEDTQNAQYNGWTCSHYCPSAFAFAPDGSIVCALVNAPGSWHDTAVAQDLYDKLLNRTPQGFFAIADSAFPRSRRRIASRIQTPLCQGHQPVFHFNMMGKSDGRTDGNRVYGWD